MKMKKILLTSAVAVALLSGCNNDYDGQDIVGSKLIVSASIDQVNTRVSDDGIAWTVGDAIGVSDNLSNPNLNIKYVAGSVTGEFSSTTGIYILGNDEVEYTAYYPYTGNENISAGVLDFKIIDEAGKYVGHNAIDFMYAKATVSRSNPNVAFKFKHQMSKVSLNIANGGAAETKAETSISYTLQGVIIDGTFDTATGEVKPGSTKGSVKVETTLGTTSSIILPPVVAESEAEPIQLVIEVGDKIYAGSLKPALDSSQEYQYTVDLSKTESGEKLQIDSPTIDGWTPNVEGNIGVEEEVNYNPTLEIGDFLCKDGTTIDKDYNLEQLDEAVKASIIGVVYYVGNPQPSVLYNGTYTETQDVLKRECPSCVNGLAIALNNAISKSGAVSGRFGSTKSDYKEWLNTQDYASGYIDATLSINNVPTKIVGYNNTKVTELAADNVGGLGTDFVDFLNTYRTTVVIEEGKTSGWYLPSYEELNIIENNYAVISASITKIGGSLLQYSDYDAVASDRFYWTSDFRGSSNAWISPLCAVAEGTNLFIGRVSNGTKGFFRFAVAF